MRVEFFALSILLLELMTFMACAGGGGNGNNPAVPVVYEAGDTKVYMADGISFTMVYVPPKSFKIGIDDNGTGSITDPYWIGQAEVTYEFWIRVRTWAAGNGYQLTNGAYSGYNPTGNQDLNPAVNISWRNAMVWCNALTEWYNAKTGGALTCVYTVGGVPIRNGLNSNAAQCDSVEPDPEANGFRLLTEHEWGLAARYIDDVDGDGDISDAGEFYPGNHASGDESGYCYPLDGGESTVFGDYAWFENNSAGGTHEVMKRYPNALGIYDMSGNAWEWLFTKTGATARMRRGGSWTDPLAASLELRVGDKQNYDAGSNYTTGGFRISINH